MTFSIIYLYNFIIPLIILFFCKIREFPKKSYLYLVTSYYLFIFGQRWFAGVDFTGYFEYYLTGFKAELGYYWIQQFLAKNNIYFGVFIFIIYAFTTLISLWFFRKFTKSNLSIFLFFLSEYHIMSINPLRTYIAINIFLIGIYFWECKSQKFLGIVFMALSPLFHLVAIIATIFFLIFKLFRLLKTQKIMNYILLIIPFINFKSFIKLLVEILLPRYLSYFGSKYDYSLSWMNIIRYYAIVLLFLYFQKKLSSKDKKEKIILGGMYSFLILIGIATHFAALHRIAYFYKIFEPIFFLYILDYKKIKRELKVLIVSVFILNYVGIIYKDMGVLWNYKFRPLHIYNKVNNSEYWKELEEFEKSYKKHYLRK